ncbi:MAG: glycosyltransferase [Sulfurimonas sp.]|uniref:glycosyltransferase n=1 Tax=Sulfurimonas sp. TaxID=2022749 RepID=UPI0028CE5565|nr:glycosyltransferase [Sulfurimonas sp.]MDT8339224.1 glycosyltransferase [Sulfurimonas sp.]
MKILINTSTLYFGGGVQVALSFINELITLDTNEYHIFLSLEIERQLDKKLFGNNFNFYIIDKSPSKLLTRKKIVSILNNFEKEINPDVVFTVFGPAYWRPKALHLLGFADGWVYNPDSIAFDRLSFFRRIKMRLAIKYKLHYLHRDADFYVLETNDAASKLSTMMKKNKSNFFVVGNTFSNVFSDTQYLSENNKYYIKLPAKPDDEFRLLYVAHNHPSKNLSIINKAIKYLQNYNIKFIVTIDEQSYTEVFDVGSRSKVINVGPVPQYSCPSLYNQTDAVISTSLLETFSAVYPESMKMKKPLLSSDFSFARDICGDSALYFDALDPKDTSEKIIMIMNDKTLQEELVKKGINKLQTFETAQTRAKKYLDIIKIIKDCKI